MLKIEKIEYRAYIKTCALLGKLAIVIADELMSAYGDLTPIYSTDAKWTACFKEGRENIEDNHRSGRPITLHTDANIELVRRIIEDELIQLSMIL